MLMEIYIKAIGMKVKLMDTEFLLTAMVQCTKVNGIMIFIMVMELKNGILIK
jgi:hypothetical protein